MASAANTTNQLPLLKRLWGDKVAEPMYQRSPFLASIKKDTSFGGEGRYVNVTVGPTAGGSASFAEALANQDATTEIRFFVTHKKEYQVFSIQNDLIARSKGDKNALLEAVKQQADKARYAFFRSLTRKLTGNGGGALGQISSGSTVSSTSITLASRADVTGFEPKMWVTLASDDGSAASPAGVRDGGTKVQITAVNRSTGVLTASAAWNTIAGAATSDYIHRSGDYAAAMTGLRGWAPVSDPSASENFFGVDRTLYDIQRQSGIRFSGSGGSKEETLIGAGAEAQMAGARCKKVHCNPLDLADLVKELGSKVTYMKSSGRDGAASVGFDEVMVHTPVGVVGVTSEPDFPQGYAWMVDPDDITLRTAGDCPTLLNKFGNGGGSEQLITSATDDAVQGRLGCYGNLFCDNPGHIVVITW